MARGRFLCKDISLDMKVGSLSDDTARLLFTWMIAHLDREGRIFGEPHLVKAQIFPRSKISVAKIEKYLREMETFSLIYRYFNGKERYIYFPNFEKHQVGLRKDKEAPSVIPAPDGNVPTESLPTSDGVTSGKVKVKVKDKENIKSKGGVKDYGVFDLFVDHTEEIAKLLDEFPDLAEDFEPLIKNCVSWWEQQWIVKKKELKDPVRAARNWLIKERGMRKSNPPGIMGRSAGLRRSFDPPTDEDLDKEEGA